MFKRNKSPLINAKSIPNKELFKAESFKHDPADEEFAREFVDAFFKEWDMDKDGFVSGEDMMEHGGYTQSDIDAFD